MHRRPTSWLLFALSAALPYFLAASIAHAQAPAPQSPPPDLRATITALDKRLFDAYNTCDLDTLSKLVSDDLEFYHDKTGLAVGRTVFLKAIKENICGKVHRTLIPDSLEVYPLEHFGAVEIGSHTFTHPGIDTDQGDARFVMLWRKGNGNWQLTRVISYDHGSKQQ